MSNLFKSVISSRLEKATVSSIGRDKAKHAAQLGGKDDVGVEHVASRQSVPLGKLSSSEQRSPASSEFEETAEGSPLRLEGDPPARTLTAKKKSTRRSVKAKQPTTEYYYPNRSPLKMMRKIPAKGGYLDPYTQQSKEALQEVAQKSLDGENKMGHLFKSVSGSRLEKANKASSVKTGTSGIFAPGKDLVSQPTKPTKLGSPRNPKTEEDDTHDRPLTGKDTTESPTRIKDTGAKFDVTGTTAPKNPLIPIKEPYTPGSSESDEAAISAGRNPTTVHRESKKSLRDRYDLGKSYDLDVDLNSALQIISKSIESGDLDPVRDVISKAVDLEFITMDDISINKSMSMGDVEMVLAKGIWTKLAKLIGMGKKAKKPVSGAGTKLKPMPRQRPTTPRVKDPARTTTVGPIEDRRRQLSGMREGGTGTYITPRQREDMLRQEYGKDYTPPTSGPSKGAQKLLEGAERQDLMGKSLDPAVAARMNTQPISRRGYISHPIVGTGMRNDRISENFNKSQSVSYDYGYTRRLGGLRPLVKSDKKPLFKEPKHTVSVLGSPSTVTGHRHLSPGEMAKLEAEMREEAVAKKKSASKNQVTSKPTP